MNNSSKAYIAITASIIALLGVLLNVLSLRAIAAGLRKNQQDQNSSAGRITNLNLDVRRLSREFQRLAQ